jgi:leucyl aminopeptidase (aminopeptidase T)
MKELKMFKFYPNSGKVSIHDSAKTKPLVKPVKVTFKDGSVKEFKSSNEYKAWRKVAKKVIKKSRKAVK